MKTALDVARCRHDCQPHARIPAQNRLMIATPSSPVDTDRDNYRKFYDTELSALLSAIWGGNLHMGLFAEADEPLPRAQQRAKDYMARAAELAPGRRVLEVACGAGATAVHLANSYGVRVDATNIAQAQLEEAAENARAANVSDRVSFAFADYHHLPGPSDAYDCWWCQEALLYATDRMQVFSEARRVVKPGGRIVFSDLTLSDALPHDERQGFASDIRAPHLWRIEDYERLFAQVRFRIIERQDWSSHVPMTFAAVARNLAALRRDFAQRIGEDAVRGTEFRIARQLDMARAGHLGWCFYALEA
ncbi:MAG TPA: methyltransferase domain-containing protein [Aestuariivirgaceae bacterium]|nr:methyltransferase domain-containing protein [Aestuariivirgaceae bacterium]